MSSRTHHVYLSRYGDFICGAARILCRIVPFMCCGALASGCSLSIPMAGFGPDTLATGSIKPTAHVSPIAAEMDVEDWRRAKSALDTALDPQGNGAQVTWDNPLSGMKGSFVPLAQPYPKEDGICRAFSAHVEVKGQPERLLQSSACRKNSGEWIVGNVAPVERRNASLPNKSNNLAERDTRTQLR